MTKTSCSLCRSVAAPKQSIVTWICQSCQTPHVSLEAHSGQNLQDVYPSNELMASISWPTLA
jgi:ribosomal protein L37AE/L43A